MIRTAAAFTLVALLSLSIGAQKKYKPASEWSEKDAQKILNDSPWGRTQVETDTSELFFSPTANPANGSNATSGGRAERGATNQATSVNYHVRFLSARPIREALSRAIETAQKEPNPQLTSQLQSFVKRDFSDYIVVTVTYDTKDPRFINTTKQAFTAAVVATLKTNTYLDRNDGKRLFLSDYQPAGNDGLGAKFIFPRNLDGKPFLSADFSQVRFYSEIVKNLKLDVRFKVSDMIYNGILEY